MRPTTLGAIVALGGIAAPVAAQAPRALAPGIYVLPGKRNDGWIDLGTDVLAIVADRDAATALDRIRKAAGKPIRASIAPNGSAAQATAASLVPASRGAATTGLIWKGGLTLGASRRVELREIDRAVSAGNAIVTVPDAKVLFAGDLVGDGAVPDSIRTEAWITALDRLRRLEPAIVVPGSGPPGGPELIESARTRLAGLRSAVRQAIGQGRSIEQILAGLPGTPTERDRALARQIYREAVGLVPPPMIEELELRPGPSPTAATPGWTKPTAILVRDQWADKAGRIAELKYVAPGVEIRVAKTPAEAAAMVVGADASLGWFTADVLAKGTKLRWIQWPSAGVEGVVSAKGFADSPVILTNAQRIYGPPIAEHVFGLLLGLTRAVNIAVPLAKETKWDPDKFVSPSMPELRGKTMLVLGLGGIGTEVATLARGFGMRVIATRAAKGPPTDLVDYIGAANELAALAPEADVIVDCLPYTKATDKAVSAAVIATMKPTAYLVNIGRGRTVDTDALVAALRDKRIAGAGFDVTDPEPLPPGHPLWSLPNVVITPHVASNSDAERERTWLLFRENLRRFVAGEPLLSVVDKKAGY